MKRLLCLFGLMLCLPLFDAAPAMTDTGAAGLVCWRMTEQERIRDGSMVTSFDLRLPDGAAADEIETIYIASPQIGKRSMRQYGAPEFYRKAVTARSGKTFTLAIRSGRSERIDLISKISCGDGLYYAQTMFSSNGISGKRDAGAKRVDSVPDWPLFRFTDSGFIRARTETPISVTCGSMEGSMKVFEDGQFITNVNRDESGTYTYTPPHDEELSQESYTTNKDLVMEIRAQESVLSLYLPLYRVYYGKTSLRGGVGVLGAGLFAGVFLLRRREKRAS
jgi:hypothetical protein